MGEGAGEPASGESTAIRPRPGNLDSRSLQARRSGSIINVASLLVSGGAVQEAFLPRRAVHAATKSFLVTFSQVLAGEVRDGGVRVQQCRSLPASPAQAARNPLSGTVLSTASTSPCAATDRE